MALLLVLLLCLFSKFSGGGKGGAMGRAQAERVCAAAAQRAAFYAQASLQDETAALALLHACECRAHAAAAKDLAERTGVVPRQDLLALIEDSQDQIDALVQELHG